MDVRDLKPAKETPTVNGATLEITAIGPTNTKLKGTVTLVKEGGAWKWDGEEDATGRAAARALTIGRAASRRWRDPPQSEVTMVARSIAVGGLASALCIGLGTWLLLGHGGWRAWPAGARRSGLQPGAPGWLPSAAAGAVRDQGEDRGQHGGHDSISCPSGSTSCPTSPR